MEFFDSLLGKKKPARRAREPKVGSEKDIASIPSYWIGDGKREPMNRRVAARARLLGYGGSIKFPTRTALAIWNSEILGQLSDGEWENISEHFPSVSSDHWLFWHALTPSAGGSGVVSKASPPAPKAAYGKKHFDTIRKWLGNRIIAMCRKLDPEYGVRHLDADLASIRKSMMTAWKRR